jgi:predicted PhzF superfamily epimerase YddE/YHI9
MQSVAAELALSETAFLKSAGGTWSLRWFTPTTEVSLCGHATLAAAHWLWQQRLASPASALVFQTASGALRAIQTGVAIELELPIRALERTPPPRGWKRALPSTDVRWLGTSSRGAGERNALVLTTCRDLAQLQPDLDAMRKLPIGGWIITARGIPETADVFSRYFAPRLGVDEDPVTGSAHATLASYWPQILGRPHFHARQISARGGEIDVTVHRQRVRLAGRAVTVAELKLTL